MNAGKSTSLLQINYNYREQGRGVSLFTAAVDDRDGVGRISSRLGIAADAETFTPETDMWRRVEKLLEQPDLSCVLIDEAQFLTEQQVVQLHRAAHILDIPIICFGIRTDFLGRPFPGAAWLLSLADDLEEIKAICACERKSTMNIRLDERGERATVGDQLLIGGNSRYKQVCARCFYLGTA